MAVDDYLEHLAHDVAVWQREGLITAEQERAILARIGAGEPRLVGALRLGWLITAVSLIGALILGAGVVLLFAANWEQMPDWFRTAVIFAGMIIAYGAGYALTYRYGMDRIGGALILLGVLLFEAGLFLLAQIYNMPVDSPRLLLLATLGTLPVAYAFGSRIVLLVTIADFIGWIFWELAVQYEDDTGRMAAALILLGAVGVALYALGRLHAVRPGLASFGDVYVLAGALLTLALVYVFTFDEPWAAIIDDGVDSLSAPAVVYVAVAIAAVLVATQWYARARGIETAVEAAALVVFLGVALVVATWPAWTGYALVFNALFFGAAAGFVTRGYLLGDERYVNFGLALVALGVVTRYIDVFWSLLTGSLFYIIGGLLLLAVAFGLETLRRRLIAGMDDGGNTAPPLPGTAGVVP
jgi:uncharacterized membrane protein